ncbi:MAG: GIY-YIG nuclease family protein [bacterium]|nr:GIY-YIG nuclease family protein [bacterium]
MKDLSKYADEDIIAIVSSDAETELKKRGYEYGWYKKEPLIGAVYILVNPAFPDLVKIGYADDVAKRLKSLNGNSGLPDPFHCYAIYKVKKRMEDLKLHSLIDTLNPELRHSKNREFYEMNYRKAYEILSAIAQINGDEEQLILNPFGDDYFNSSSKAVKPLQKSSIGKADKLTFSMVEVPVGSVLTFIRDPNITCVTKDDVNRVEFEGQEYSISALAAKLLGYQSAQGGMYFMYNGEVLTSIRAKRQ